MTFAIGTPLLDTCVLAVLSRGDAYGYALTAQVKEVLDISESTLYPTTAPTATATAATTPSPRRAASASRRTGPSGEPTARAWTGF